MSAIRIRRGFDVPLHGGVSASALAGEAPALVERTGIQRVAILPSSEALGCKPKPLVEVGDRVRLGQPLFIDWRDEDALFCSPASGRVADIQRGARRVVLSMILEVEEDREQEPFPDLNVAEASAADLRRTLLRSGFWPDLRQRPYDTVARSTDVPAAIFVTGIDTRPLAVSPRALIAGREAYFRAGLAVLQRLTESIDADPGSRSPAGPVYLCTAGGEDWGACLVDGVEHNTFTGPHPAGCVGTHIHHLKSVGPNRLVWHIGAQAVADIGQLFTTRMHPTERRVALVGPTVREPKILRTRRGASTYELTQNEFEAREARVIAGSALDGAVATPGSPTGFLNRFANQLTVLEDDTQRELLTWALPVAGRHTHSNTVLDKFFRKTFKYDTDSNGSLRAIVPVGQYESVMPLDVLPTQLIKALASGDVETAEKLGVLELCEEDLALCEYVDNSKQPITRWLREMLTGIEKES